MRSFFGSILLILVLAALGATIYYHWSTNLEFELRNPDEPEKTTQVINMEKRAAALQAAPAAEAPAPAAPPAEEVPAPAAGIPEATEL